MEVVLYSNHCPRCKVLEAKLKQSNIAFVEENNLDKLVELGFQTAPALQVNGELMDFGAAVKWINGLGESV